MQAIPGASYLRKATSHFGWDWGPKLPAIGIWKELRLEGYSAARLEQVHLRQRHAGGNVTLEVKIAIERWLDIPLAASIRLAAPDGSVQESKVEIREDAGTVAIAVAQPQLWWPNGLGQQPLYQVEVILSNGDMVEDRRAYQVGLRTLSLEQAPDEWGRSFTFVVNGLPIFAKGSNWIPADSFPTRVTGERLEALIRSAAGTHQNMLRVWGGGFYEDERFYDLCDRYGILVWQDLMFSCSVYPLNEAGFLNSVQAEISENVRRLRHRACLALWCGNNEMELGWESWGWDRLELSDLKESYAQFFHHTLPAWIAVEDPDHAYWPSSPSSNTVFQDADGQQQGDAHYWDVWHGRKPFTAYRDQFPRFMSEFGFQSLPPLETIRTFAAPEDWNMTSYIMEHHQRSLGGNGLMISQMADTFRIPKDFSALVYLSMVLQAEGIRYGVEHWRRNRQRVSGTLYWQLNDCWPAASWSSLDYHGRWKALHYAARRFYAPVLLSLVNDGGRVDIHVTNDRNEPWHGAIAWSLASLDGEALQAGERPVIVGPLASVVARTIWPEIPAKRVREVVFLCELSQSGRRLALVVAPFVPDKHLKLGDPRLAVEQELAGEELALTITARSLARFVELALEGVDVIFSDNYFDVPANAVVRVTCPLPHGWTLDKARQALRIRSLVDTY
jgi:beta-mannosidase